MSAARSAVCATATSASEARARARYDSKFVICGYSGSTVSVTSIDLPPLSCFSCCKRDVRSPCASLTRVRTSIQSSFTLLSSRALASPASIRFWYICNNVSLLASRSWSIDNVWLRRIMSIQRSCAWSNISRRCLARSCSPTVCCIFACLLRAAYFVGKSIS